jgi:hypothetical protein
VCQLCCALWWCCAGELERAEKRLATLAGVRPPYMDEYEALTGQLQVQTEPEMAGHGDEIMLGLWDMSLKVLCVWGEGGLQPARCVIGQLN